jgi:hypothetical protein
MFGSKRRKRRHAAKPGREEISAKLEEAVVANLRKNLEKGRRRN